MNVKYPQAVVRKDNGTFILEDPMALTVVKAYAKSNCDFLYKENRERILHFVNRAKDLGTLDSSVVVIVNVDDPYGSILSCSLMPDADWQPFRDAGQIPIARGLALKDGIIDFLEVYDKEAATSLKEWVGLPVVVVDYEVAQVYSSEV